jgi:hypothetical protein
MGWHYVTGALVRAYSVSTPKNNIHKTGRLLVTPVTIMRSLVHRLHTIYLRADNLACWRDVSAVANSRVGLIGREIGAVILRAAVVALAIAT